MRRYVIPILFVLILVTPFALRAMLGSTDIAKPSDKAIGLKVLTSHAEGTRREFGSAFSAWYRKQYGQDVYIDYIALSTGQMDMLLKGGTQVDVIWGGGDFEFDNSFSPYLKGMDLDPVIKAQAFPSATMNGLSLYDLKHSPPHWYGAALSAFGIIYNRQVLQYLKLPEPQTWSDLARPGYAGWLALGDPVASGSVRQAFMAIVEKAMADAAAHHESEDIGWQRGMGEIRLICANARSFSSGSNLIPGMVASGDSAAGMIIDFYGRNEVESVPDNRLGYVQPKGATIINPDPIALAQGVQQSGNEIIARRFIEFVLSRQGQLLWNVEKGKPGGPVSTNLRRLPIMPSVYEDLSNFTDKMNPFTASQGFNKSPAREKTLGQLGDFIQCSCIDCLPELQRARKAILRSPPDRARELTKQLAMFPFDQKEALRRASLFKVASPVEKLSIKRAWTDEFKNEYQTLRSEAMK